MLGQNQHKNENTLSLIDTTKYAGNAKIRPFKYGKLNPLDFSQTTNQAPLFSKTEWQVSAERLWAVINSCE